MTTRADLQELILDLGGLTAEVRQELRPALRKAAQPILLDARRRASWSERIPGAISLKVGLGARNAGMRMVVDASKAPHARPFEVGSKKSGPGTLRHPVFPDVKNKTREEWAWVSQRTRPFFFPAVQAGRALVLEQSAAAVMAAARTAGFR